MTIFHDPIELLNTRTMLTGDDSQLTQTYVTCVIQRIMEYLMLPLMHSMHHAQGSTIPESRTELDSQFGF